MLFHSNMKFSTHVQYLQNNRSAHSKFQTAPRRPLDKVVWRNWNFMNSSQDFYPILMKLAVWHLDPSRMKCY